MQHSHEALKGQAAPVAQVRVKAAAVLLRLQEPIVGQGAETKQLGLGARKLCHAYLLSRLAPSPLRKHLEHVLPDFESCLHPFVHAAVKLKEHVERTSRVFVAVLQHRLGAAMCAEVRAQGLVPSPASRGETCANPWNNDAVPLLLQAHREWVV